MDIELSKKDFTLLKDYIYNKTGISLMDHKITLVKGR